MSMASLEDLLEEEGFKRRKPKLNSRNSISSEGRIKTVIYGKNSSGPLMTTVPKRTGRTRSDVPRYDPRVEFSPSVSFTRQKTRMGVNNIDDDADEAVKVSSNKPLVASEITEVFDEDDIVETGRTKPYKDVYLNSVRGNEVSVENDVMTRKGSRRSSKQLRIRSDKTSFKVVPEDADKFDEGKRRRARIDDQTVTTPALDEIAVKAVVSILTGQVRCFLTNGEFRSSLRHNSFASLNLEEGLNTESKVIDNLEQAMETVERAAEDNATLKEVKRASLQLSVITGLNSKSGGFTSGIPNFQLSACAHLYLSVIYVMQNKERISSKHLLQVFCDSPFQARTVLLPDLWENLFQPHLSHLKRWYEKEANLLSDSSDYDNDLRRLERAYNEVLDIGTCKLAIYYKDWISEGVEAPSLPFIEEPSFSVRVITKGAFQGHVSSPLSNLSPKPMVSKRLYDEVFGLPSNIPATESQAFEEEDDDINVPEDKQLILYSHDMNFERDREVSSDYPAMKDEAQPKCEALNLDENSCNNNPLYEENLSTHFSSLALQPPEENKSVINRPEDQLAEHKLVEESVVIDDDLKYFPNSEDTEKSLVLIAEPKLPVEEHNDYEIKPSPVVIPKDFMCPLTGFLFEEPVSLETGQTYERRAIEEWFHKGYLTCPLTRKPLQCRTVPPTNLILKRVVDEWKIEHFRHLLALISLDEKEQVREENVICVLEQLLLTAFITEERVKHARRVISIGGLHFLLRKFNEGRIEAMGLVLKMLLICIEAGEECRDKVGRNISRFGLLEMLHCDHQEKRASAVSLLIELICMKRRIFVLHFLEGLQSDETVNALHDICMYLEDCPEGEKPLVSVLILHLDLLRAESKANDVISYRQKAVDALTTALERSLLSDNELQRNCSKALLMLGGSFSKSGKLMTEDYMLKQVGFLNYLDWDNTTMVDLTTVNGEEDDEEETARNMWLSKLSISLLGDGKKSFLSVVSKCLSLGETDLVRVCLTTVAWLSYSLALLPDASEFQVYALTVLLSPLKQCMAYQERVEHKVLASFSLLTFSKNPECKEHMMELGEEMVTSLENLEEVTWTAKELML